MEKSKKILSSQERENIIFDKSILDQILDDFTDSLIKNQNIKPEVAQSLREIIYKSEHNYKEKIINLFKNENTQT